MHTHFQAIMVWSTQSLESLFYIMCRLRVLSFKAVIWHFVYFLLFIMCSPLFYLSYATWTFFWRERGSFKVLFSIVSEYPQLSETVFKLICACIVSILQMESWGTAIVRPKIAAVFWHEVWVAGNLNFKIPLQQTIGSKHTFACITSLQVRC